jgi:hypothetical protein
MPDGEDSLEEELLALLSLFHQLGWIAYHDEPGLRDMVCRVQAVGARVGGDLTAVDSDRLEMVCE